jgi:peroxiredoxin
MPGQPYSRRLHELEEAFASLATQLPEGAVKEGFSLLHAMQQELWRNLRPGTPETSASGLTITDIANLYKSAPKMGGSAQHTPLPVGTPAPEFSLPDANGQQVALADLRGSPVVLVFYPLDWSPTCSDQLSLYQSEAAEFARLGAKVVGISVDSIYSHGAWAAVRGLTFPLLADFEPKGAVARRYQVYREGDGFSERALYIIDSDGIIRYSHVSPELDHVPDIYDLFHLLESLRQGATPERQTAGVA